MKKGNGTQELAPAGFMSHGTHLPQLHLQNHHVGGLKLAVFLQGVYFHPRNWQTLQGFLPGNQLLDICHWVKGEGKMEDGFCSEPEDKHCHVLISFIV